MNPTLENLIKRFRKAQDLAVETLIQRLSIPQPESNLAWAFYCSENGLHQIRELKGTKIYAHGFGVALEINDVKIDFDWGSNGEPDGFDSWRLYSFSMDNCSDIKCTDKEVQSWLEKAENDGELIKEDSLYYDPKRRAIQRRI